MQLPNKLYSYKNSTLSLIPMVMNEIGDKKLPVADLYKKIRADLNDPTDFMSVMDCLYALRAVDLNEEGEVFICLSK